MTHKKIMQLLASIKSPERRIALAKEEATETVLRMISASGKRFQTLKGYHEAYQQVIREAEAELEAGKGAASHV